MIKQLLSSSLDSCDLTARVRKLEKESDFISRIDCRCDLDDDDAFEFRFYKILDEVDPVEGSMHILSIGSFKTSSGGGIKLEDSGKRTVDFNKIDCDPRSLRMSGVFTAYPVGSKEISLSLSIGYQSTKFDLSDHEVINPNINFSRFWTDDLQLVKQHHPEAFSKMNNYLTEKISQLVYTCVRQNFKRGWVYHKYWDQLELYSTFINGVFLSKTQYFFDPRIFYNQRIGEIFQEVDSLVKNSIPTF